MRGVRVHGAAHEEFVCELVDELADWDYLKVNAQNLQISRSHHKILRARMVR
jgi:hypothetical protein